MRAGVDRAADWLANAGYEVGDAEPPQIAEAAAAWFDAIWADVGTLRPGMERVAGRDEAEFVKACLAQGMFKPVDQAAQLEAIVLNSKRIDREWLLFAITPRKRRDSPSHMTGKHAIISSSVCARRISTITAPDETFRTVALFAAEAWTLQTIGQHIMG